MLISDDDQDRLRQHYQDPQGSRLCEKVLQQYPKLLTSVTQNYLKNNEVVS